MAYGVLEEFFWATMFRNTVAGPREMAIVKRRLAHECARYVTLELATTKNHPTEHIFAGASEQLLEESEVKAKAIIREALDSGEQSGGISVAIVLVALVLSLGAAAYFIFAG